MPITKEHLRNSSGLHPIAEIFQPRKRRTLTGNYEEPRLPFARRMKWLEDVQRLAAQHTLEKRSYPHKLMAVARVMAQIGDVCRLSFDSIAQRAGCWPKTAQACVAWMEEHGALTWDHTARKHTNGKMVRSSNLYTLISSFTSGLAMMVQAMRSVWRERKPAPKGNVDHGTPQLFSYREQKAAQENLARVTKERERVLIEQWANRRAT